MPRLTKIYTKTGDDGTTGTGIRPARAEGIAPHRGVRHGRRIEQPDRRSPWAAGLNDHDCLGAGTGSRTSFFTCGLGDLCIPEEDKVRLPVPEIGPDPRRRARESSWIRLLSEALPPLATISFFPAERAALRRLHVARTVCRRAERLVVALSRRERNRGRTARGVFEPPLGRLVRDGPAREPQPRRAGRPLEQPGLGRRTGAA